MSRDIWTQCAPKFKFSKYSGQPWRIVEAQHVVATRKLVDSDEEQAILEDLLEGAKPPQPYESECSSYHYLLWTPFRYPPLKRGSRFGSPDQRGLWYGSERLETTFAEKAYYLFLFREGSSGDFGTFDAAKTAFRVNVLSTKCANLLKPPFDEFADQISSRVSYQVSQQIGTELRNQEAGVIIFRSARCQDQGANLAVLNLKAFKEKNPVESTSWFCVSSEETVEFKPVGHQIVRPKCVVFKKSDFEVNGKLPDPQF